MGLESGMIVAEQYRLERKLRHGDNTAWLATDTQMDEQRIIQATRSWHSDISGEPARSPITDALDTLVVEDAHPNLANLIDYGVDDEWLYAVSDYIEGIDGPQYTDQQVPIRDAKVLRGIGIGLCDATSFLHENELVYSGLFPEAILLHSPDTPILINHLQIQKMGASVFPRIGGFVGPFHAPEVGDSETTVGPWSAVYSIGKVLIYLLTGETISDGEPVQNLKSGIDPQLVEILDRTIRSAPAHRYRNPTLLKRALETGNPTPDKKARLHFLHQDTTVTVYPGDTIGSQHGQAAIRIDDPEQYLSLVHAKLETQRNGQWCLKDRSLNGTWIARATENDFNHRLVSREGKRYLEDADGVLEGDERALSEAQIADGDIIALVHPDYGIWFEVDIND